jgi:hypothetical protein
LSRWVSAFGFPTTEKWGRAYSLQQRFKVR